MQTLRPSTTADPVFLEAAIRIGAEIARDAIWHGDRCNWVGASTEKIWWSEEFTPVQRALRSDLYGGTAGMAVFFARLYAASGNVPFRRMAAAAMRQALARPDNLMPDMSLGFYTGYGGVGYAAIVVGALLERPEWIDRGVQIIETHARDDRTGKRGLDVTTGIAGLIPLLVHLAQRRGLDRLLDLAQDLGRELLNAAEKHDHGWSWNSLNRSSDSRQPSLLGFSHGTAGYAWALGELHVATGDDSFAEAAREAMRYERRYFDTARGNWPDFRTIQSMPEGGVSAVQCQIAWCHGAPGAVLPRLRLAALFDDPAMVEEARRGLRTIADAYRGMLSGTSDMALGTYCLCHGHGGNFEPFIVDAEMNGNWQHWQMARQIGHRGIEAHHADNRPWSYGAGAAGYSPDLMVGKAGIGYFYLRLFDPVATPSILILLPDAIPA